MKIFEKAKIAGLRKLRGLFGSTGNPSGKCGLRVRQAVSTPLADLNLALVGLKDTQRRRSWIRKSSNRTTEQAKKLVHGCNIDLSTYKVGDTAIKTTSTSTEALGGTSDSQDHQLSKSCVALAEAKLLLTSQSNPSAAHCSCKYLTSIEMLKQMSKKVSDSLEG